jgi:HEAT repeat protein
MLPRKWKRMWKSALNWLQRLGRSEHLGTQKRGAIPTAGNRRDKVAGPTTHRRSDSPVSSKQEPVLVRGKFWKNTTEVRWETSREEEAPCDTSVEGLIKQLARVDRAEARRAAAEGLGRLGQAAAPAIPALLNSAVDVDATVREAALNALNAIDPAWPKNAGACKAFPDLVAALKSWCPEVSGAAFKLLSTIGQPVVPNLAGALLNQEDTIEKVYVMRVLARIGSDAASAVSGLTRALSSQFLQARIAAAEALANIGPPAGVAVPALVVGLADPHADARQAMAACLARVGAAAEPAVPALLPLLADREYRVRKTAAETLEQIGPKAVPALIEVIQTRDVQRLKVWIESMIQVSQWYTPPKPDLVVIEPLKVLRNRSWAAYEIMEERESLEAAQEAALRILGKFGPAAKAAVPTVTRALADPNPAIKLAAIKTLGQIGPAAKAAAPAVARALTDPNPSIKLAAVQALGQIGVQTRSAIPGLIQMLVSSNESVREAAAEALGNIARADRNWASDPDATEAIAGLARQLGKPGKRRAMRAFTVIDSAAVPVLIDTLESGNRVARENAAIVLGQIGAGAQAAIPALTGALQNDHPWVQDKAAKALAKINDRAA